MNTLLDHLNAVKAKANQAVQASSDAYAIKGRLGEDPLALSKAAERLVVLFRFTEAVQLVELGAPAEGALELAQLFGLPELVAELQRAERAYQSAAPRPAGDGKLCEPVLGEHQMTAPLLDVVNVVVRPDYILLLTFENGEQRVFDMEPYLDRKPFTPLREVHLFAQATVAFGTVVWPGNIDIAPETLYAKSRSAS